MPASTKSGADFSQWWEGKRIGNLLFATLPSHTALCLPSSLRQAKGILGGIAKKGGKGAW
jgi:hypothetical protein